MDLRPEFRLSSQIWAILPRLGPFCLDLSLSTIWLGFGPNCRTSSPFWGHCPKRLPGIKQCLSNKSNWLLNLDSHFLQMLNGKYNKLLGIKDHLSNKNDEFFHPGSIWFVHPDFHRHQKVKFLPATHKIPTSGTSSLRQKKKRKKTICFSVFYISAMRKI